MQEQRVKSIAAVADLKPPPAEKVMFDRLHGKNGSVKRVKPPITDTSYTVASLQSRCSNPAGRDPGTHDHLEPTTKPNSNVRFLTLLTQFIPWFGLDQVQMFDPNSMSFGVVALLNSSMENKLWWGGEPD